MFDDFFVRALVAGVGVALVAGPLGCFIVWRRMAYFGATISHAALLGVALALYWEISVTIGVFGVAVLIAPALLLLERRSDLSADTLLGILAHGMLALGLVVAAFVPELRADLMSYLFGDILSVSRLDIVVIYAGSVLILLVLRLIWRPLLAATLNADLAKAEGLQPERARFIYTILIAAVVAIAMKIIGVLLIISLMIIPAAAARSLAQTPEQMAFLAALMGGLAVVGGLMASLWLNTQSGPSVVVAALALFLMSLLARLRHA